MVVFGRVKSPNPKVLFYPSPQQNNFSRLQLLLRLTRSCKKSMRSREAGLGRTSSIASFRYQKFATTLPKFCKFFEIEITRAFLFLQDLVIPPVRPSYWQTHADSPASLPRLILILTTRGTSKNVCHGKVPYLLKGC